MPLRPNRAPPPPFLHHWTIVARDCTVAVDDTPMAAYCAVTWHAPPPPRAAHDGGAARRIALLCEAGGTAGDDSVI
jgi:hypothetical protein